MTPFPSWIILSEKLNYTGKKGDIVFLLQKIAETLDIKAI